MKRTAIFSAFILLLAVSAAFYAPGVVGTQFPDLTATTMKDKKVNIPGDLKNKYSLIGIAYSNDAEKDLHTWLEPVYDKFIAKNELMPYDINLYFIPMFTGAKSATAESAKNKLAKETDPELQPYVLIYKGELDKYKTALGMDKKALPYFFVLDKMGKIVYTTSGSYTEDKMDAIEDALD
jgi:hypothetical protein